MSKKKKTITPIIIAAAILIIVAILAVVIFNIKQKNESQNNVTEEVLDWIEVDCSEMARVELFGYAYTSKKIYIHIKINRYEGTESIFSMSVRKENTDGTLLDIDTAEVRSHKFGTTIEDDYFRLIPAEQEFSFSFKKDLEKDSDTKAYNFTIDIIEDRYLQHEQVDYEGLPDQSYIIFKVPVD